MQLVVEISEDTFFDLKKKQNRTEVDNAVLNGTPLPKGHNIFESVTSKIKIPPMPECKPPKSENIPIREGHELQDYTKIVSVQLLEVLKTEIDNIYQDRPSGYNHRQRMELYCKVRETIQKHIDDLSGEENREELDE